MNDQPAKPPAIIDVRAASIRKRSISRQVDAALRALLEDADLLEAELHDMKASVTGTKGSDERRRFLGFTRHP